jgi:hypothetical protein
MSLAEKRAFTMSLAAALALGGPDRKAGRHLCLLASLMFASETSVTIFDSHSHSSKV